MKKSNEAGQDITGLRTLERGLDVLDLFCHGASHLTLSEIAVKISLSPSTASRLINTLANRGYIFRDDATKKFQLGIQGMCLVSSSYQAFDLRPIAAPFLQQLFDKYNESVSLYVLLDGQRVCLDRIETTHGLRRVINLGDRLSLTRGAAGKILLAFLTKAQQTDFISADPVIGEDDLERIRNQGYAVSDGEREIGVAAVAAPVFNANGQVVCALSLSGPSVRLPRDLTMRIVPDIVSAARQFSAALGHKNP